MNAVLRDDGNLTKGGTMTEPRFIDIISTYLEMFATDGGKTSQGRRIDLDYFVSYAAEKLKIGAGEIKPSHITAALFKGFVDHRLKNVGEAPASVRRRYYMVRALFRDMAETIPGFRNPGRWVRPPVCPPASPKGLNEIEHRRLVQVITAPVSANDSLNDRFMEERDRAIVAVLRFTGLRREDAINVRVGQIKSEDGRTVIRGVLCKGAKVRNVFVDGRLEPILETYLQLRQEYLAFFFPGLATAAPALLPRMPLFITTRKSRPSLTDPHTFKMSPSAFALSTMRTVGLNPHRFRHERVHEVIDEIGVPAAQREAAHANVNTTMAYAQRLEESHFRSMEDIARRRGAEWKRKE